VTASPDLADSPYLAERTRGGPAHLSLLGSTRMLVIAIVSTLAAALIGALVFPALMPAGVTAETRLVVGNQTLGAQRVPGYAEATVTLAETYARFITMGTVKKAAAPTLSDLQATVIPGNPVIRVQATAANARDASAGVAAAAQALIKSVNQVAGTSVDQTREIYLAKRTASDQAQAKVDFYRALVTNSTKPSATLLAAQEAAVRTAALARIESDAYVTIVQNELVDGTIQSAGLTVIMDPLVSAPSKKPMLLGLLLGGGLAVLGWGAASVIGQARRREQASLVP